jgi:hypothetical protein
VAANEAPRSGDENLAFRHRFASRLRDAGLRPRPRSRRGRKEVDPVSSQR